MTKSKLPEADEPIEVGPLDESGFDDLSYEPPPELMDPDAEVREPAPSSSPGRFPIPLRIVAGVAVVLVIGGALLAYRAHNRRKALHAGLARAEELLRLDTAAGYAEAAALLEPLAELDPLEAASVRAFALGMLFADYRNARAATEAEALLVRPGRAAEIPRHASLAMAALGLGRRSLGDATAAASAAHGSRWSEALQARIALAAGSLSAAAEPAALAAADAGFPAGLALHGDVARRARRDAAGARAAYAAALEASPNHPRAAYGLAKLALSGQLPAAEATPALQRLLADVAGTPPPERARAALHLAALRLRAGDRAGAADALDAAGLDAPSRVWAERAATVAAASRGPYRAVAGAPFALQSASDDDPAELQAVAPAPPQAPARPPAKATAKPKKAAVHAPARKAAAKPKAKATARTAARKTTAKKPTARAAR